MSYVDLVRAFLESNKLLSVLSFSGGFLEGKKGEVNQSKDVESFLVEFFELIHEFPIAILTGGTNYNFPGMVTRIAKDFKMKVIGVMPETGADDPAPGLDLKIVVPPVCGESAFGDESPVFVRCSNAMVTLGGGPGAGVEIFQAVKDSLDLIYHGKSPIAVIPVYSFGGLTDIIRDSMYYDKFPKIFSNTVAMISADEIALEIIKRLNLMQH